MATKKQYPKSICDSVWDLCDMLERSTVNYDFSRTDKARVEKILKRARNLVDSKIGDKDYFKQELFPFAEPCTGCSVKDCEKTEKCKGFVYVEVK